MSKLKSLKSTSSYANKCLYLATFVFLLLSQWLIFPTASRAIESEDVLGVRDCDSAIRLSGYAFMDEDGDGSYDYFEDVFEGINLVIQYQEEETLTEIATSTTDETGYWDATVCPGSYQLKINTVPAGYKFDDGQIQTIEVADTDQILNLEISRDNSILWLYGALVAIFLATVLGFRKYGKRKKK